MGGKLPEDRIIWKGELQRHCEEENEDVEETIEVQEDRIKMYKADGNGHFTEEKRVPDSGLGAPSKDQDGGRESQWTRRLHPDGDDKTASTGKDRLMRRLWRS